MPYIRGLSKKCRNTCNKLGIQVHFKGQNTVQTILMAPKDKDSMSQKSKVTYHYKCSHRLSWAIHRGIQQDFKWQIQGTPQDTITHPSTQSDLPHLWDEVLLDTPLLQLEQHISSTPPLTFGTCLWPHLYPILTWGTANSSLVSMIPSTFLPSWRCTPFSLVTHYIPKHPWPKSTP